MQSNKKCFVLIFIFYIVFFVSVNFISVSANTPQTTNEEPIVLTGLGNIKGSVLRSRLDALFYAFRGIRYGKSPVGDLRFRVSVN